MTSTEIATYRRDDGSVLGIDEIDAGDMVAPRFSIDHNKGVWRNSQTEAEYQSFTAILLGRAKQRIMWKEKLTDEADAQCRSNNFKEGFPNNNPKSAKADLFPWDRSVFPREAYPAVPERNNLTVLPCESCNFKEWVGEDKPPCKEQWTFAALVFLATPLAPEGEWVPALMTIQGTGIPSVKPYISQFIQRRAPLFTAHTTVTLRAEKKAGNDYFVPVFTSAGPSDNSQWDFYASSTESFMMFLKQDPRGYEGSGSSTIANPATQQAISPPATPAAPAAPEPEDPWAKPVGTPEDPWANSSPQGQEVVDAEIVEDVPAAPPAPNPPATPAPAAPTVAAPVAPAAPAQPAQAAPAPAAPSAPVTAPPAAPTPPAATGGAVKPPLPF